MPSLAGVASAFGAGARDTFAPPIVVDGGKTYSQSTACATWAGRKCGLADGVDDIKAMQILSDMVDVFEGGIAGALGKESAAAKDFLESDRLKKLMNNLENGIQGPFWFGDKPTYVDFFACNMMDWCNYTFLDRLESEFGATPMAEFGKFAAVVAGIRALDSYKVSTKPIATENFKVKDAVYEAWKK